MEIFGPQAVAKLSGYAASLTPLHPDLSIDLPTLAEHVRWLLNQGLQGVLFMGSTGEAPSFSVAERTTALEYLIETGIPPESLMVGTGCPAVPDSVALTQHALDQGVFRVLVMPPYYFKNPAETGIFEAFEWYLTRFENGPLKVFLYHFPQMSTIPFTPSLIARLRERFPHTVTAIKDSSSDWDHMRGIRKEFPDLHHYPGNERFLSRALEIGAHGCVTATLNVSAGQAAGLLRAGSGERAEWQRKLDAFRLVVEKYPMVPALKRIMADLRGEDSWLTMRPPHQQMDSAMVEQLRGDLEAIGFPRDYDL